MKNCGGSAEKLKSLIDNIPSHYMVCLNIVNATITICVYVCRDNTQGALLFLLAIRHTSKDMLTNPRAIKSLQDQLHSTFIYKCSQDFARVSTDIKCNYVHTAY